MEVKSKLITVVVPVYKVEPYINKCLDSLIVPDEQKDLLEVIIVNDGTPDNSAEMAREYEKKYPTVFRVIDKPNGGHGSAWNRGLKEATGKYIKFLDSDDWFDTNEFSRLISKLGTIDVDIILSHYNRYYVQTGELIKHPMYKDSIDQSFSIDNFNWEKLSWEGFNFWGCTYNTKLLQQEYPLFLEGVFYDDAILFIAPVILAKSIHVFDATIYNYLIGRPGQTVSPDVKRKHLDYWIKTHFQLFDFTLAHFDLIQGKNLKQYIVSFIKEWLHSCLLKLGQFPYHESKYWAGKWECLFTQFRERIPRKDLRSSLINSYFVLPFPCFYFMDKSYSTFLDKKV